MEFVRMVWLLRADPVPAVLDAVAEVNRIGRVELPAERRPGSRLGRSLVEAIFNRADAGKMLGGRKQRLRVVVPAAALQTCIVEAFFEKDRVSRGDAGWIVGERSACDEEKNSQHTNWLYHRPVATVTLSTHIDW